MKKTLIVLSTNRELEPETRQTLEALHARGCIRITQRGSADVAYARCEALTVACEQLRGAHSSRDVVLMLDDDMAVQPEVVQELLDTARRTGEACSAVYATKNRHVAGCRWKERPTHWLVGLGCIAIPAAMLLELERESETFSIRDRVLTAFTWCGPDAGAWIAEDYRLSIRLGGVRLLPLEAGHVKKGVLYPDEETLRRIAEGSPLHEQEKGRQTVEPETEPDP